MLTKIHGSRLQLTDFTRREFERNFNSPGEAKEYLRHNEVFCDDRLELSQGFSSPVEKPRFYIGDYEVFPDENGVIGFIEY